MVASSSGGVRTAVRIARVPSTAHLEIDRDDGTATDLMPNCDAVLCLATKRSIGRGLCPVCETQPGGPVHFRVAQNEALVVTSASHRTDRAHRGCAAYRGRSLFAIRSLRRGTELAKPQISRISSTAVAFAPSQPPSCVSSGLAQHTGTTAATEQCASSDSRRIGTSVGTLVSLHTLSDSEKILNQSSIDAAAMCRVLQRLFVRMISAGYARPCIRIPRGGPLRVMLPSRAAEVSKSSGAVTALRPPKYIETWSRLSGGVATARFRCQHCRTLHVHREECPLLFCDAPLSARAMIGMKHEDTNGSECDAHAVFVLPATIQPETPTVRADPSGTHQDELTAEMHVAMRLRARKRGATIADTFSEVLDQLRTEFSSVCAVKWHLVDVTSMATSADFVECLKVAVADLDDGLQNRLWQRLEDVTKPTTAIGRQLRRLERGRPGTLSFPHKLVAARPSMDRVAPSQAPAIQAAANGSTVQTASELHVPAPSRGVAEDLVTLQTVRVARYGVNTRDRRAKRSR